MTQFFFVLFLGCFIEFVEFFPRFRIRSIKNYIIIIYERHTLITYLAPQPKYIKLFGTGMENSIFGPIVLQPFSSPSTCNVRTVNSSSSDSTTLAFSSSDGGGALIFYFFFTPPSSELDVLANLLFFLSFSP